MTGAPGRPCIGIDVGGTKMLGVVLEGSEVVSEGRRPTPHGADQLVDGLADLVAELVESAAGRPGPIGVGVPALVGPSGDVGFSPHLPVLAGLDVAGRLHDQLRARGASGGELGPVSVGNDATCATVGEWTMGSARGCENALVINFGTGIGGGVVSDGKVRLGAHGFAGEFGHMVVDPAGPPCPCGRRGCWERFASGGGLARLAREAAYAGRLDAVVRTAGGDPEAVKGEHVTSAAVDGDDEAHAVLDELGWWIALGLSNLVLAFDPEVVVLGGGLASALALAMESVQAQVANLLEPHRGRPPVRVVQAALGERAGAVGAAIVARGS